MAQQVKIAGALFENVPSISVPDASDVWHEFMDTSDADAVAADIASGKTAYVGGVKIVGTGESVEVEPLSVTANGVYSAPTGTAYSPVTVNVEGGGGEGVGALLTEVSLGYISPSGTSEEDTGMTVTVSGINDYDMLIFAISSDTSSNSVHLETVTNVFLLASSDISTKDSYGIPGGRFNISRNASGIVRSKFYGTNYGVFPKNITITDGDMTSKIYARYSVSYTGSIDGNYTCRVYGVNLCDMIGIQL